MTGALQGWVTIRKIHHLLIFLSNHKLSQQHQLVSAIIEYVFVPSMGRSRIRKVYHASAGRLLRCHEFFLAPLVRCPLPAH